MTKLHLPENWQINSSSDYYLILKHDTIHDIPIFDIYIRDNLEFTICVFAVCIPANHEIYMKFSKPVKNITLSNFVREISHYCICEGIKNEKIICNTPTNILFQKHLIQMLQHHQHLQNFTDQLHVHVFAKLIPAPTAKNLKIKKHYMFKNPLKSKR